MNGIRKIFFLLAAMFAVAMFAEVANAQQCNVGRQQSQVSSSSAVDLQNQAIANLLLQQQLQRQPVAQIQRQPVFVQQPIAVQAPTVVRFQQQQSPAASSASSSTGGAASSSSSSVPAPASLDLQTLLLPIQSQNVQASQVACLTGGCGGRARLGLLRPASRSVSVSRSVSRSR